MLFGNVQKELLMSFFSHESLDLNFRLEIRNIDGSDTGWQNIHSVLVWTSV